MQKIKETNGTAYIGQGDPGRIQATQDTARHPIEHPIYIGGFSQTALDGVRGKFLQIPTGKRKSRTALNGTGYLFGPWNGGRTRTPD